MDPHEVPASQPRAGKLPSQMVELLNAEKPADTTSKLEESSK